MATLVDNIVDAQNALPLQSTAATSAVASVGGVSTFTTGASEPTEIAAFQDSGEPTTRSAWFKMVVPSGDDVRIRLDTLGSVMDQPAMFIYDTTPTTTSVRVMEYSDYFLTSDHGYDYYTLDAGTTYYVCVFALFGFDAAAIQVNIRLNGTDFGDWADDIVDATIDMWPSAQNVASLIGGGDLEMARPSPNDPFEIQDDWTGWPNGPTLWSKIVVPTQAGIRIRATANTDVRDLVVLVYADPVSPSSISLTSLDGGDISGGDYFDPSYIRNEIHGTLDAGTYFINVTTYQDPFYEFELGSNLELEIYWEDISPVIGSDVVDAVIKSTRSSSPIIYPQPWPQVESFSSATADNTNVLILSRPAGTTTGDLLLAPVLLNGMGSSGQASINAVPTGWSALSFVSPLVTFSPSSSARYAWYTRIATGTEPTQYQWGSNINTYWAGAMLRISNAGVATLTQATNGNAGSATLSTRFTNTGRPSIPQLSLHAFFGVSASGSNSWTAVNPSLNIGVPDQSELLDISASQRAGMAITSHQMDAYPTPSNIFLGDGIDTHGAQPSIAQPIIISSVTVKAIGLPYIGLASTIVAAAATYPEVFRDAFSRITTSGIGISETGALSYAPITRSSDTDAAAVTTGLAYVDGSSVSITNTSTQVSDIYRIPTGIESGYIQFDFYVDSVTDGGSCYIWGMRSSTLASLKSFAFAGWMSGSTWKVATQWAEYSFTPSATTWYTVKAEIQNNIGLAERIRVWKRSDPEPSTWNTERSISSGVTAFGPDPFIKISSGFTVPFYIDNLALFKGSAGGVRRYSGLALSTLTLKTWGVGPPYNFGHLTGAVDAVISGTGTTTHSRVGPHYNTTPSDDITLSGLLSATLLTGDTLTEALREIEERIEMLEQD